MALAKGIRSGAARLLTVAAIVSLSLWLWSHHLPNQSPPSSPDSLNHEEKRRVLWRAESVSELAHRTEPPAGQSPNGRSWTDHGIHVLNGVVRSSADGNPVEEAFVYLLKKGWAGVHGPGDVPTAGTNERGQFRLLTRSLDDCWLGVVADGYFGSFKDADLIRSDDMVQFTLVPGPSIEVDIDGAPSRSATHVIIDFVDDGQWELPGPGSKRAVHVFSVVPASGHFLQKVGSSGPVVVRVLRIGFTSSPKSIRLNNLPGRAEFTFAESCGLRIRVVDSDTGKPVTQAVRVDVLDRKSGMNVNGAIFTSPFGEFEIDDRLPPGTFEVRVASKHYVTWVDSAYQLLQSGRRQEVEVRLKRDADLCDLRLEFPELRKRAGIGSTAKAPRPTIMQMLPADRECSKAKWEPLYGFDWDYQHATANLLSPAGRSLTFVIWDSQTVRTALVRLEEPKAGEGLREVVNLADGLLVKVPALSNGSSGELVHLALIAQPSGRKLPLLRITGASFREYSDARDLPGPIELGPYPFPSIVVHAVYEDGSCVDRHFEAR